MTMMMAGPRRWLVGCGVLAGMALSGASPVTVALEHFQQHARILKLAAVPGDAVREAGGEAVEELAENSMSIVGALVQAFLKKEVMTEKDRQCLVQGSEDFTHNIMQVSEHIVMLIQEITGQRGSGKMPGLPDISLETGDDAAEDADEAASASGEELRRQSPAAPAAAPPPERAAPTAAPASGVEGAVAPPAPAGSKDEGAARQEEAAFGRRLGGDLLGESSILMHLASILSEMGTSIQLLVKLSKHIANNCVEGEALEALEEAAAHARNMKYIAGHFLANGADVVTEFAHGAIAYKSGDFEGFGRNLGTALRKMLLSKTTDNFVPEGLPGKYMMVNMSMGFVKGFFGKGFTLGVTLDRDPTEPLRIDLEGCIASNLPFFEQILSTVAFAYTKHQEQAQEQHRKEAALGHPVITSGVAPGDEGRVEFGTALAVAAMQLPDALRRCDIGQSQGDMLIDSVKAFGAGMHLSLSTPNKKASVDEITDNLGQTINDWKKLDWNSFGFDIGLLLQEMVLAMFPKKYAVDSTDGLRQQLTALRGDDAWRSSRRWSRGAWLEFSLLVGASLAVVAALAAVRRGRSVRERRCRAEEAQLVAGDAVLESCLE